MASPPIELRDIGIGGGGGKPTTGPAIAGHRKPIAFFLARIWQRVGGGRDWRCGGVVDPDGDDGDGEQHCEPLPAATKAPPAPKTEAEKRATYRRLPRSMLLLLRVTGVRWARADQCTSLAVGVLQLLYNFFLYFTGAMEMVYFI